MPDPRSTGAPSAALTHAVFFTLIDDSPTRIRELVDSCRKYLSDHPGILAFAAGARTPDLSREANDTDFHVGLQILFDGRASHDVYFSSPEHLRFVEDNRSNWARVRIFNCDVG